VTLAGFILLLITALCMAVANLLMKTGIMAVGGFSPSLSTLLRLGGQPAFVFGLVLSGVAAPMWFRILATQKLSTCYPLFVGLTYSLITLAAFYFLHETISFQKLAGLVAIVVGIAAVARG
jgi:multidrug transporter EmrE-like cation transporter